MNRQELKRRWRTGLIAAVMFVLLLHAGCVNADSRPQTAESTGSKSNTASVVSDPVLNLVENPLYGPVNRSVRISGGEPEILLFLTRYAEAITTLEIINFSDICADTAENAVMVEYLRYWIAFLRVGGEKWPNYKLAAEEINREQNGDALTVTITFEQSYDNVKSDKRAVSTGYEWEFVLDASKDTRMITSVKELPSEYQGGGQWFEYLKSALQATGLPLETPEQIHAAGDEVIRYFYKNGTLPQKPAYLMADGKMPENAYTVALPYTDSYQLVCVTPGFSYGITTVGLADKNGKLIFDVNYKGIGVTENGYFVLCRGDFQRLYGEVYIIVGPDGYEVARYHNLSCYTVYENGIDAYYEASYFYNRPAAPYEAKKEYAGGAEEYWLLDENFEPLRESYDSLILSENGATVTRKGTLYNLDRNGNVISKKEAGVFKIFFEQYRLTIWYNSWYDGDESFGLTDRNGGIIYEQKYCKIEMPFEDRVVLFTGNNQSFTERAALLADAKGNIINTQFNMITYLVTKDGYIGIAQSFGPDSEVEVGCKEAGCWLVDKDGNRVSEKYKQIGNYTNELDGWLYMNTDDTTSPLMMQKEDGTIKTVPLSEVLIKSH